ncbi:MAG: ribonuclease T2 family protein [Sphingomonadaceae bacterium]
MITGFAKTGFALTGTALLLLTNQPAQAQAYQCRMPRTVTVPPITPDATPRRVPVTGYTLALSWSPEFCRTRKNAPSSTMQCSGDNGRFGFIVHGLWPEGRSTWPQWCPTPRTPSPALTRQSLCMMPSAQLVAHEWAKHGACMVRTPDAYYKITRILWDSLTLPEMDRLSRQTGLSAGDIRAEFVRLNGPRWKPEHVGIRINRSGWLQELYLCYGKDYLPTRCGKRQYGPADSARVKVWRGI